jgi:sulfide:quinone oxidoreductase
MSKEHYTVVIVGGGAAGISVAANLRHKRSSASVAIIEPSESHYYQPAFTLVGGGEYLLENTRRSEGRLIPAGVKWIKDYAESFKPENNIVTLRSGNEVEYDYLVVCPGIQLDWNKVEGLTDTLGKNGVCSNYSPDTVNYSWECIKRFEKGTAVFTQPPMPIKCAGAPQKILYLAADRFRKTGRLNGADLQFCTAIPALFGVPLFAKELEKVMARYGAKVNYNANLVAIDGTAKQATFEKTAADGGKEKITLKYDMIHVTPPQSAPDFIKSSPFANEAGWMDVNRNTLQNPKFANVFGLGDATSTPNAKTAAAVRKQVPVVVKNIMGLMAKQTPAQQYDGYGSCPLTTSLHTVMLAEFAYDGKVTPSFPMDPRVERRLWWIGKKYWLPLLYWDYMLKGLDFDIPHKEDYLQKFMVPSSG